MWAQRESESMTTYAFLDEGSKLSLCTQEQMRKVQACGTKVSRTLSGINGVKKN